MNTFKKLLLNEYQNCADTVYALNDLYGTPFDVQQARDSVKQLSHGYLTIQKIGISQPVRYKLALTKLGTTYKNFVGNKRKLIK